MNLNLSLTVPCSAYLYEAIGLRLNRQFSVAEGSRLTVVDYAVKYREGRHLFALRIDPEAYLLLDELGGECSRLGTKWAEAYAASRVTELEALQKLIHYHILRMCDRHLKIVASRR